MKNTNIERFKPLMNASKYRTSIKYDQLRNAPSKRFFIVADSALKHLSDKYNSIIVALFLKKPTCFFNSLRFGGIP